MADDNNIQPFIIESDIALFEVGNDISYLGINHKQISHRTMINASSIYPFFIVYSGDITFAVAFSDNTVKAVFVKGARSLAANISLFKTPEGVSVGMSYRDVLQLIPNLKLVKSIGWAYEAILPSGWKIGFMTGSGATDYFPDFEDKIIMIYKN
jgi:hypothetical protein